MKKAFKVVCGTMLAAALSSTAFAGESEFLARSAIWVTGTYTESSNNGQSYGDLIQFPGAGGFDGVHRHVFVDPDMSFDYALGFSYHIPCSHTRLFFSYDHYNDTNESTNSGIRNLGFATVPTAAYGSVNNHAQEFRIGLGHALKFGRQFNLDVNGFFEWDEVKRDIIERNTQAGSTRIRNTFESAKGWGPGFGARIRALPFMCYQNWGVFAGANTSLIWAENDYEATLNDSATGLLYDYDPESTESMVGKIDISFGINYSRKMRDFSCSMIDIALGLRYMNMFNVFKNGNAYDNPVYPGSNGISYSANLGSAQDFGRVGPFLTFAIGGAGA